MAQSIAEVFHVRESSRHAVIAAPMIAIALALAARAIDDPSTCDTGGGRGDNLPS